MLTVEDKPDNQRKAVQNPPEGAGRHITSLPVEVRSARSSPYQKGHSVVMSRKPLSAPARAIIAAQLSRRRLLHGAGAVGACAALAACGFLGEEPEKQTPTKKSAAADKSDTDKTVRWANWPLYLDYDDQAKVYPTLEAFQSATGIKATYAEDIEESGEYFGKILPKLKQGQDVGQDIVTMADFITARMITDGYAQELDPDNIPNKSNILPNLANVDFDPGRKFSLTWQSYMAGIAWNKEVIPEGLKTVSDLWQPRLRGQVEVLSDMRDTTGLIMQDLGTDISSDEWGDDEFLAALDVLQKQLDTGQIRQIKGNSYQEDLISGDATAVLAWSGDIAQLNLERGDRWVFAIPERGGTISSDNLVIPLGSPHKKNAEMLMNYYYDPAVAAQVAAYVQYVSPVQGAKEEMEKIDPALVQNNLIFPSPEFLENVKAFRTLAPAEEDQYSIEFQKVLGN
jgi:spermidine/putrescine transport system substrate-binding protein